MSLFNVDVIKEVNGLQITKITEENIHNIDKYYATLKADKMTANAMEPMLLYWKSYYCIYEGYLCLFYLYNELVLLTLPFNEHGFMKISDTIHFMKKHGLNKIKFVLESYFKNGFPEILNKYFNIEKTSIEYVYDVKALCEMSGGAFKRIRKKVHNFENNYNNVTYRWSTQNDVAIIKQIYDKWCCDNEKKKIHDRRFVKTIFNWMPNNFLIFFDGDIPIGFINYIHINRHLVYISSRKLNTEYRYLSQFVEHIIAIELYKRGYLYSNRDASEGDYSKNNISLDEFKRSFNPIYSMQRYELKLKE